MLLIKVDDNLIIHSIQRKAIAKDKFNTKKHKDNTQKKMEY